MGQMLKNGLRIKPRDGEEVAMSDKIYDVPADWKKRAFADDAKYQEMYARSIKDPNGFWGGEAKRIDWIKPFSKVKNTSFDTAQRLDQMVRGWHAQRLLQLRRPPSRQARRAGSAAVGRRRPQGRQEAHL